MIHPDRVEPLNSLSVGSGDYVLYWMQASQRAECNHALEYAVRRAGDLGLPVVCAFGLTADYPEATARAYRFMLQGLRETAAALGDRGIGFVCRLGSPDTVALDLAQHAALLVADRGYTAVQKQWRRNVAARARCPAVQVESDVIVPVGTVSAKEEYAARTMRPKLHALWEDYLVPLAETGPRKAAGSRAPEGIELEDVEGLLRQLGAEASCRSSILLDDGRLADQSGRPITTPHPPPSSPLRPQTAGATGGGGARQTSCGVDQQGRPQTAFVGGTSQAHALLDDFIRHKLARYDDLRNDPALDYVSHMSPYLHFGQISPLTIALAVLAADSHGEEGFLEELIVRRELSVNFVHYNPSYDRFDCLPDWAQATLLSHADDPREYLYTEADLESAQTHDPYWNAAQREMLLTGKMHNYMRMYWGKKIIEWTSDPRDAFAIALRLNNRYELDGRDPNSYAGVAWCFGKHDRPWKERPIFGTVRYMNAKGLQRKFDMEAYVRKVEGLGG